MLGDLLVEHWLREERLVYLVVSHTTVADQVDDAVLAELPKERRNEALNNTEKGLIETVNAVIPQVQRKTFSESLRQSLSTC